jgi:hypothetical protein
MLQRLIVWCWGDEKKSFLHIPSLPTFPSPRLFCIKPDLLHFLFATLSSLLRGATWEMIEKDSDEEQLFVLLNLQFACNIIFIIKLKSIFSHLSSYTACEINANCFDILSNLIWLSNWTIISSFFALFDDWDYCEIICACSHYIKIKLSYYILITEPSEGEITATTRSA